MSNTQNLAILTRGVLPQSNVLLILMNLRAFAYVYGPLIFEQKMVLLNNLINVSREELINVSTHCALINVSPMSSARGQPEGKPPAVLGRRV